MNIFLLCRMLWVAPCQHCALKKKKAFLSLLLALNGDCLSVTGMAHTEGWFRAPDTAHRALMPQLTATAVLQLVLLLSAVPAQYFISRWCGSTSAQRNDATARCVKVGFSSLPRYVSELRNVEKCSGLEEALKDPLVCLLIEQTWRFRLLRSWKEWRASYLNGTVWMEWANQQMAKVQWVCGVWD